MKKALLAQDKGLFSSNYARNAFKQYNADLEKICWQVGIMDYGGPFSWKNFEAENWLFLHSKMSSFETMKWSELPKERHHSIDVDDLSLEAKKRLLELKRNDIDQVFSFALGGKIRLIGIRDRHVFKLLWWDPEHQACPSKKKHT